VATIDFIAALEFAKLSGVTGATGVSYRYSKLAKDM